MITDHMKDVISQMNEDFEYTFDKDQFDVPEHYRIPTEPSGEVVKDDCDGYATGLLYRLVDYDREEFWRKLHSDEAAIVKVWAKYRDGSVGGSHAILRWDSDGVSYFADNIYPYWRTDMMHNLQWEYTVSEVNGKMNKADKWVKLKEEAKDNKKMLLLAGIIVVGVLVFVLSQ